jgi:hypothetical protein
MKNRRIIKHELIEVPIPAGTTLTEFQIPEQNNLREVELLGIQVHVNEITPYSVISQKPTLSYQVMEKCFLTLLNYAGFAFLHLAPSLMFQTMRHTTGEVLTNTDTTGGTGGGPEEGGTGGEATASSSSTFDDVIYDTDIKDFARQKVNWPQSKLNFSRSITSDIEVDSVVLISVYYYDPKNPKDNDTEFAKMH